MQTIDWGVSELAKSFPGVRALRGVDMTIKGGHIHALIGENGCGKSTLIKILAGVHRADSGEIKKNGNVVQFQNPIQSKSAGVATIYQEFSLVPQLNIAENISLGNFPKKNRVTINSKEVIERAQQVLSLFNIDLDVNLEVASLSVADQQIVEIAKAVSINSQLLILDEPTTALSSSEVARLHKIIENLAHNGKAILYVSHRLEELFDVADEVTVLRDGAKVAHSIGKFDRKALVEAMVGRSITKLYSKETNATKELALSVHGISSDQGVRDVSLDLHKGEVLGLGGLVGSKRTEIARAIFGADKLTQGFITISDERMVRVSPSESIKRGVGFVSESRKTQGLFFNLSAASNITIAGLKMLKKRGILNRTVELEATNQQLKAYTVSPHAKTTQISLLSGGNQQKIVLSRWNFAKSRVLILDEPTQGIDVGAKHEVYKLINEATARGVAVLLISSELPELLGLSDRVAIVKEGTIKEFVDTKNLNEIELLQRISVNRNGKEG